MQSTFMHLPWEKMYLSSIFMNLNSVAIKFALNNHFLPMKLIKAEYKNEE